MDAVTLAIVFHDVVYDAKLGGGGRNERDSARVFERFADEAAPGFGAARRAAVAAWIELTWTSAPARINGRRRSTSRRM